MFGRIETVSSYIIECNVQEKSTRFCDWMAPSYSIRMLEQKWGHFDEESTCSCNF